jgi:hypothetical protein
MKSQEHEIKIHSLAKASKWIDFFVRQTGLHLTNNYKIDEILGSMQSTQEENTTMLLVYKKNFMTLIGH